MTSHHFFPMLLFSVAQTSFASRGSWATVSSPAFQERCRPFALLDLSAVHDLATQLNDLSTNLATIEVRVDNLVIFAVSYIFIAVGTFFFEELLGFFSDW